jgi:hypothetical protein
VATRRPSNISTQGVDGSSTDFTGSIGASAGAAAPPPVEGELAAPSPQPMRTLSKNIALNEYFKNIRPPERIEDQNRKKKSPMPIKGNIRQVKRQN